MSECVFCRIVEKKLSAKVVYEDDVSLAFEDVNPQAPVHVLVIPKRHIPTLLDVAEGDGMLFGHLVEVCRKIARDRGIAEKGFRIVTNCNPESGQTVYHIHVHLLGGRQMHWPPG